MQADMEQIYRDYAVPVYRYLLALTGDAQQAEELTQQVFYEAVQAVAEQDAQAIAERLAFSEEVPAALAELARDGVVITGGRALLSETYLEDMFLLLKVEFEVRADGRDWTVPFIGTCRGGRVELMYIDPGWPGHGAEPRPGWADALEQALDTYDPG